MEGENTNEKQRNNAGIISDYNSYFIDFGWNNNININKYRIIQTSTKRKNCNRIKNGRGESNFR